MPKQRSPARIRDVLNLDICVLDSEGVGCAATRDSESLPSALAFARDGQGSAVAKDSSRSAKCGVGKSQGYAGWSRRYRSKNILHILRSDEDIIRSGIMEGDLSSARIGWCYNPSRSFVDVIVAVDHPSTGLG